MSSESRPEFQRKNGHPPIAQLAKLVCVELSSHRAGNVVKAGLPQHGVIEQTLHEDYFRTLPDLLPRVQATLGTGQETMCRRRGRQTAAIEVSLQRKHDAMRVGVVSRSGYQTGFTQCLERVPQLHQPTSQASARRVADSHVLDQFGRADAALVQIG